MEVQFSLAICYGALKMFHRVAHQRGFFFRSYIISAHDNPDCLFLIPLSWFNIIL